MEIPFSVWLIAGACVFGLFGLMFLMAKIYRQVAPNRALIVYGARGTNIVVSGGKLVIPMVESCKELSLELMSFDVSPQQDVYTSQGIAVSVEAVSQIKVKSDVKSIQTAAEQFLDKKQAEREDEAEPETAGGAAGTDDQNGAQREETAIPEQTNDGKIHGAGEPVAGGEK